MLHIIKTKGCKRCGGDLFLERDTDGFYVSCLQCGAVYSRPYEPVSDNHGKVPARSPAVSTNDGAD